MNQYLNLIWRFFNVYSSNYSRPLWTLYGAAKKVINNDPLTQYKHKQPILKKSLDRLNKFVSRYFKLIWALQAYTTSSIYILLSLSLLLVHISLTLSLIFGVVTLRSFRKRRSHLIHDAFTIAAMPSSYLFISGRHI